MQPCDVVPPSVMRWSGSGLAMADETEAINIAATDGEMFYGLRLAVTLAVRARVLSQDAADPLFEGTGTQLKWQDMTPITVAAKVKTQIRYATIDNIIPQFITDLLYSGRHGICSYL